MKKPQLYWYLHRRQKKRRWPVGLPPVGWEYVTLNGEFVTIDGEYIIAKVS